jgi:FAD/FMN-containing dehydrogenase
VDSDGNFSDEKIAGLAARASGELLRDGDAGYDEARSVWNGMIDRRPGVIVRCRGTADVIAAVDFARENDLLLSVHGGGHNVAGKAVCDDGVMIDLSPMSWVRVDPVARRARAGAGTKWRDFDHEAQAFGLTCTGGVVSSTGVAGLTLGGGIGYLTRTYGLACDNLVAVDLVTAAGELVHASASENEDLFWALRGGGGNFGVVTSLEFQLHEVGPKVANAVIFHPIAAAPEVLRFHREFNASAPDELACYAMVVNGPPEDPFPAAHQGKPVLALVACYSGDAEKGEQLLQPLAEFGDPLVAAVATTPYVEVQQAFDAGNPAGERYYWKSTHLGELSDAALDTVVRFCENLHGDLTIIGIEPLGGAFGRVDPAATAFAHRGVPYSFGIWTGWTDAAADEANIAWTREFYEAMKPFGAGVYVNYMDDDEGSRVGEAYGENFARLVEVKQRWDPGNLFRMNHNVSPAS